MKKKAQIEQESLFVACDIPKTQRNETPRRLDPNPVSWSGDEPHQGDFRVRLYRSSPRGGRASAAIGKLRAWLFSQS
jgi:hypothetical protein